MIATSTKNVDKVNNKIQCTDKLPSTNESTYKGKTKGMIINKAKQKDTPKIKKPQAKLTPNSRAVSKRNFKITPQ
jgi:hypothetical protein